MAEAAELDARIARLEAALDATAKALRTNREAAARPDPAMQALNAELETAQGRIEELETALAETKARADASSVAAAAAPASESDEAAALRRELAELREARAMDLAEMKALLAELEPMLESADA